jgi:hypothetical protein
LIAHRFFKLQTSIKAFHVTFQTLFIPQGKDLFHVFNLELQKDDSKTMEQKNKREEVRFFSFHHQNLFFGSRN